MRLIRSLIALATILTCGAAIRCQQLTAAAPTAEKDPQALAVAQQAVAAAGWAPAFVPSAVIVTGTITNFGGDASQTQAFTFKQLGPSQHRLDVLDNGITTTTVVSGLAGVILFGDGTKRRLPLHSAISAASPLLPFFTDIGKLSDLNVEIHDLGTDAVNGTPCHGVSITRHASPDDKAANFRDLAAPFTVWISQQSGLPVRIDFIRLADDNPYLQMHFSRSFSDYRSVNGVAVAFTQEERFEGQLFARFQFTDVQFTSALTDADFDTSKL